MGKMPEMISIVVRGREDIIGSGFFIEIKMGCHGRCLLRVSFLGNNLIFVKNNF